MNSFKTSQLRKWVYPQPRFLHRLYATLNLRLKSFWVGLIISAAIATAVSLLIYKTQIWQVSLFAFIAVCVCMFLWYLITRPKHIIQPFNFSEDAPEIKVYASKATDIFSETLRNIDKLLSSRQIENFLNEPDNQLPVVMANGGYQERIQELTSSVNINTSGVNFSLDKLMEFVIFYMARTRIHGLVQKQESGDLEISIEIVRRNNSSIYASRVIKRNNFTGFVSDQILVETINELAVEIVMKSGQQNLPTSSWENLRDFLRGLEASAQKNWWHSVALYRHAIQKEEAIKGEFGLGHYHLGSILVSQGEPIRGLEHLRIAEASEFPIPDVYYMIALTLYYLYQNHLHEVPTNLNKHQTISQSRQNHLRKELIDSSQESHKPEVASQLRWIEQIEMYCNKAFSLKNEFPEAYHLLGISHYQTGKLWERQKINKYKKIKKYTYHYKEAIKYLNKSIKQYTTKVNDLSYENQIKINSQERARLFKNYMAVTHRLASASRSLRKFTQAEAYYQEILEITPANMQNLVDLAKTYCLANKWDKVEDLYKNRIAHLNGAAWNVDVNFYRSWAQAGILANKKAVNEEDLKLLRRAFEHLDYALYQRPRFISSWEQTKWEATFQKTAKQLQSLTSEINDQDSPDIWGNSISHINEWLGWRIDSYDDEDKGDKSEDWKKNKDDHLILSKGIESNYPYPEFSDVYQELKLLRKRTKMLLKNIDDSGYVGGIINHWIRLSLAQEAFKTWTKTHSNFTNDHKSTYKYRWAIDVYAEISILACRLLAESRVYEKLYEVANDTSTLLESWLMVWNSSTNERFSPKVFEHQIATIYAWKAYAVLQLKNDPETQARVKEKKMGQYSSPQEDIEKSFQYRTLHPLGMYVQAQIYKSNKLYRLAVETLTFLLSLIESFDPKTFINNSVFLKKIDNTPESDPNRLYYYYMERVAGQQQFEDFIDRTRIHMEIAELFSLENDIKSSVEHYLMAPTWSPYKDMDSKSFIQLVTQLYRLGRFDEAFSVIQEIYIRQPLMITSSSKIKGQEASIMECILRTRLNDFQSSLEKGLSLSKVLPNLSFTTTELKSLFSHLTTTEIMRNFKSSPFGDVEESRYLAFEELDKCLTDVSELINKKAREKKIEINLESLTKTKKLLTMPDSTLLRACSFLNETYMKEIVESINTGFSNKDDRYRYMAHHLAYFLCKKSLTLLIQEAELSNNIAFNQAELRINLDSAEWRSAYSIKIFEFIANCMIASNKTNEENEGVKKLSSKDYYKEKYGNLISGEQILEKLSLYYDTLGWISYRKNNLSDARKYLTEALQLNSSTTSAHYHLARVYLTRYEKVWQIILNKKKTLKEIESEEASRYLRLAFHHTNRAQELDAVHRFENKILVLKTRIQKYRAYWDEIYFDYGRKLSKDIFEKPTF